MGKTVYLSKDISRDPVRKVSIPVGNTHRKRVNPAIYRGKVLTLSEGSGGVGEVREGMREKGGQATGS